MATAEVLPNRGKYLTFQLSRQYFALRSDRVRHILPASDIRVMPGRLPFLYGCVAAGGRSAPVLNLNEQLGLGSRPPRAGSSVLVISLDVNCPVSLVGLMADRLSEVVEFRNGEIRGTTAQFRIQGRPYGRPKTLLQPEELLTQEQWIQLRAVML